MQITEERTLHMRILRDDKVLTAFGKVRKVVRMAVLFGLESLLNSRLRPLFPARCNNKTRINLL
jgi:hypothetical protein